mmetsp:Transcript_114808/g.245086  ORF Transcript_114808/g.245086 Transcript_114808/m.245086 type:complete len:464 (-) Transcript_114808:129-1520(-)
MVQALAEHAKVAQALLATLLIAICAPSLQTGLALPTTFLASARPPQRPPLPRVGRCSQVSSSPAASVAQGAARTAQGVSGVAVALLASLPWLVELATRRRASQHHATISRAAFSTPTADGSPWEAEVAALERGAAQLRVDAEKIEADIEKQRRQEQAKWFRIFDASGSGTLGVTDLQRGMLEFNGTHLDEAMAERLLRAHDVNSDGVLQPTEFDLTSLEATLERLRQADHVEEMSARRVERERLELLHQQVEEARELAAYYASLPPANEDTGALTRLVSALVYTLPLLDSLRLGVPLLAMMDPALKSVFDLLLPLSHALNAIPLLHIFVFIALQTLADNCKLPVLLRFNMRQAVVLDIAVGTLQILQVVFTQLFVGEASPDMLEQWDSNAIVFLVLLGSIAYSVGGSFLGSSPKDIPVISAYASRYMVPTRPANWPTPGTKGREISRGSAAREGEKSDLGTQH